MSSSARHPAVPPAAVKSHALRLDARSIVETGLAFLCAYLVAFLFRLW